MTKKSNFPTPLVITSKKRHKAKSGLEEAEYNYALSSGSKLWCDNKYIDDQLRQPTKDAWNEGFKKGAGK